MKARKKAAPNSSRTTGDDGAPGSGERPIGPRNPALSIDDASSLGSALFKAFGGEFNHAGGSTTLPLVQGICTQLECMVETARFAMDAAIMKDGGSPEGTWFHVSRTLEAVQLYLEMLPTLVTALDAANQPHHADRAPDPNAGPDVNTRRSAGQLTP